MNIFPAQPNITSARRRLAGRAAAATCALGALRITAALTQHQQISQAARGRITWNIGKNHDPQAEVVAI